MATATPASVREIDGPEDAWSNINNALTSNNQYATCNVAGGASSRYLVFYGFTNATGGEATVINVEIKTDGSDSPDEQLKAYVVANAETADAAACATAIGLADIISPLDTSDAVYQQVISRTWQATDGVVIQCTTANNGTVFSADSLTITYTEAGGGISDKLSGDKLSLSRLSLDRLSMSRIGGS